MKQALRVAHLLLVAAWSVSAATAPDTEKLAAHLKSLHGHSQLSTEEYRSLRKEYLAWLDLRVRSGWNANQMNWDLANAGLVLDPGEQSQEKPLPHAPELLAIAASIDLRDSGACDRNTTVILYDRKTSHRVGEIDADAEPEILGYRLLSIDVGERDYTGQRIVAASWAASTCPTRLSHQRIRIGHLTSSVMKNLLTRDLSIPAGSVPAEVDSNIVTFHFTNQLPDNELKATSAIARYQISETTATRLSPLAFSRAGFIGEWLTMTDANPTDWAAPEAVQQRAAVAAEFKGGTFEWGRIASCGNGTWDIAINLPKATTLRVFRLQGNRASDLRILKIGEAPDDSCHLEDDITGVSAELLW